MYPTCLQNVSTWCFNVNTTYLCGVRTPATTVETSRRYVADIRGGYTERKVLITRFYVAFLRGVLTWDTSVNASSDVME
jgi:hypothetical protein